MDKILIIGDDKPFTHLNLSIYNCLKQIPIITIEPKLMEVKENMFYYLYSRSDFIAIVKWLNKQFWSDLRNKNTYQAIQDWHCYKSNKPTNFKRRIHCRKEICRKHQRNLPAIRAQERLNRASTG